MDSQQRRSASGSGMTSLDELLRQAQQIQGGEQVDNLPDQYQQLLQTAPPEVIEQAHVDAFAQLSAEERRSIADSLQAASNDPGQTFHASGFTGGAQDTDPERLAAMFAQAQQQQPDLLGSILGGGGRGASNPLMQMVLAAVASLVMKRLLGGAASQNTGQVGGGGGLADILGQILGGAAGAGGAGGLGGATDRQRSPSGGMPGLDDLLQQRTGQGGSAAQPTGGQAGPAAQPTGGGGRLEDLLGQLGAGGSGGLGAILGQLAQGMQGANQSRLADTEQPGAREPRRS